MMAGKSSNQCISEGPAVDAGIPYELFLDCVHCGLCTAACPTYLESGNENDSPRGRIYLMRGMTDGRIELTQEVRRHLELCLDCRSCETACPSGVQYGRLIEPFRIAMERTQGARGGEIPPARSSDDRNAAAGPKTDDWFHRLVLFGLFPYPRRVRLALAPARLAQVIGLDWLLSKVGFFKLLPERLRQLHDMLPRFRLFSPRLPEILPAQGKRRARVALFTGCVGDVIFRETNWATARVLQANGCEVVVPRAQGCCGAIHYHSGNEEPALGFISQNCTAFNPADVDAIIVNVAGCGSMLKDYGHIAEGKVIGDRVIGDRSDPPAGDDTDHRLPITDHRSPSCFTSKVRDITEFLVELGPLLPPGELPIRATYHDACHLVHAQKIRTQPRKLLEMIPGLELVPLEESEICCGAAGTYNLTEPEMAERLATRKHRNIEATGAQAVFTANAGCLLQIGRKIREARLPVWVAHPIEALDLSYRRQPALRG
ncbi:MAG: 4Fe-4S dicluster domain-containing protein [Planctomycetes bacterium]|nr:4Fe-4S dicluster domain-containing protein [Planctomycetota bacterium]